MRLSCHHHLMMAKFFIVAKFFRQLVSMSNFPLNPHDSGDFSEKTKVQLKHISRVIFLTVNVP